MSIFFLTIIAFTSLPLQQASRFLPVQADPKLDKLARDIMSRDIRTIMEALAPFNRSKYDNRKLCNRMIDIITNKSKHDKNTDDWGNPKQLAIFIMAYHVDYRSDKDIAQVLVDNIHIRFLSMSESIDGKQPLPDEVYPALRGLLLIGEKAKLPILEKIKSTDDHVAHDLLAYWFSQHYGRKMALYYLGSLIDENPKLPLDQRQRIDYVMGRISNSKQ